MEMSHHSFSRMLMEDVSSARHLYLRTRPALSDDLLETLQKTSRWRAGRARLGSATPNGSACSRHDDHSLHKRVWTTAEFSCLDVVTMSASGVLTASASGLDDAAPRDQTKAVQAITISDASNLSRSKPDRLPARVDKH